MCDKRGNFIWKVAKFKGLQDGEYLRWAGIVDAIPKDWKNTIKTHLITEIQQKLCENIHLNLEQSTVSIDKVTTKQI